MSFCAEAGSRRSGRPRTFVLVGKVMVLAVAIVVNPPVAAPP